MFPQMRTSSTTNTQHPTPKRKACSLRCALYHHLTLINQHPNAKHVPSNAHFINT